MSFILCLAHYCDTHGPTPLMVTEGLPVGCTSCFEDEGMSERRPSSSSRSLNPADGLAAISRNGAGKANSTSPESESSMSAIGSSTTSRAPPSTASIETPPESPRVAALSGSQRRDSSFRKTYDENDKKRAIPCENCALTLPRQTKEGSPNSKFDNGGPVLRTRKPYERISILEQPSPPKSDASASSSDSDAAITSKPPTHRRTRSRNLVRVQTSSSNSSFNSTITHEHYIDYTSTHEPLSPSSFSVIRQSCLRTLSCETLPPTSVPSNTPQSPGSSYLNTPPSSSSSGPILFGDPQAGYTTAFIFRLPDPSARGRRRVYALMGLSTHRERVTVQAFPFLSSSFRELALWIQALAETELERAESPSSPRLGSVNEVDGEKEGSRNSTPTSSFLGGGRGRGGDYGYGGKWGMGMGMTLRARGLAELVGLPDFFLELHGRFVRLLIELGLIINGR